MFTLGCGLRDFANGGTRGLKKEIDLFGGKSGTDALWAVTICLVDGASCLWDAIPDWVPALMTYTKDYKNANAIVNFLEAFRVKPELINRVICLGLMWDPEKKTLKHTRMLSRSGLGICRSYKYSYRVVQVRYFRSQSLAQLVPILGMPL